MALRSLLLALFLINLCDSSNKNIYLLDLYTCVEEFKDYCSDIPRLTVRAVTELANTRDDILPGYTISTLNKLDNDRSLSADGEVIITSAILDNFYKELDFVLSLPNSSSSPIVLGSPLSFVSNYAVDILGSKQNFVQVCFESTFAKLNDSPFFYRIGPNEAFFNDVRLELLLKNNWTRVGLLSSSGTFSSTAEDFEKKLRNANISIINNASFVIKGENIQYYLTDLKEKDIRIIIALITVTDVPLLMCAAYDIGLIDDDHVWILPEMNLNDIRRLANNTCDVDVVLRNALMVGANYHSENHSLPFGTDDLDDLLIKYNNLSSVTNLTDILSRVIADTTWAVILALNHSVELLAEEGWSLEESVTYNGVNQNISDIIMESLNQVKFSGLSGIVDFTNKDNSNQSNDSARILQIMSNLSCTVEIYKVNNETMLVSCPGFCNYAWGNDTPTSSDPEEPLYPNVPVGLLIFVIAIFVIFTIISVVLAAFIIVMRNNEYIKTSSLTLNLVIIISCMFVYFSSIPRLLIYGARHYNINEAQFITLCHVQQSFYTLGWGLGCLFLFLKSWRLYRIQNNKLLRKKIRFVSEKAIFMIMLILLFPTVMFTIAYNMDGYTVGTDTLKTKDGLYEYSFCEQEYHEAWDTLSGVYNLVLLIWCLWQVWHISQLTIKRIALLEGIVSVRLLLLIIIFTSCLVAIDVILSNVDNHHGVLIFYILRAIGFFVLIIFMIFIPKIYLILRKSENQQAPASSSNSSSHPGTKITMIN